MPAVGPYVPREAFGLIAGDAALDLVNTVSWRLAAERRLEHLGAYDDLVRWAEQAGVIGHDEAHALLGWAAAHPDRGASELARVVHLREEFYAAAFEGGPSAPVAGAYADAVRAAALVPAPTGWSWEHPLELDLIRHRVAVRMLDLLRREDSADLRQCSDDACGWVFLDTSPRRNRRWCVAADCGNRNRVREHYARTRAAQAVS